MTMPYNGREIRVVGGIASHPNKTDETMAEPRAAERVEYIVEGGHRLSGAIEPSGNKNAALPIIAAALLTDQPVVLTNVPRIRDVEALVQLLSSLGAETAWTDHNTLRIHARDVRPATLDPDLCSRIRASILLAGPVLARCGEITLPPPGGDVIGRRRLDSHFLALRQLGAQISLEGDYVFRAEKLVGADVFLDEPSVTHDPAQLRFRAACSGSRPFPRRHGCSNRGDRHQLHDDPWRRTAFGGKPPDRA
jgi:UDP-N-acetylglucosamine 1-carboxyvinyltransferase